MSILWSVCIALGNINYGYSCTEILILWNFTPCIYDQGYVHKIDEQGRHNYNILADKLLFFIAGFVAIVTSNVLHYGRRKVIILANILIILSSCILMIRSFLFLIIGRCLRGFAIGMLILTIPIFIKDISIHSMRAPLLGLTQFMITFGVFLCFLLSFILPNFTPPEPESELVYCFSILDKVFLWQIIYLFPILPSITQIVLLLVVYKDDSPEYRSIDSLIETRRDNFDSRKNASPACSIDIIQSPTVESSSAESDTYRLLCNSKHSRSTAIGIIAMLCVQFSGINLIDQYAFLYKLTENEQFLLNFVLSIISCVCSAVSLYLVTIFGRKGLLMCGLLSICCCNTLLFQVFDDEELESDKNEPYTIILNTMVILIIIVFTMSFHFSISSVIWIYVAETMTPKGIGIAILFRLLVNVVATTLPYLAINLSHYDPEVSFIKYMGGFFFMYAGCCLINFFLLLVFFKETKDLTDKQLRNIYEIRRLGTEESLSEAYIIKN